jgi:hypothetical protein
MALEAKYLLRIVGTLGHASQDPAFDAAGADHGTDAATVKTVLEAALAPGGLVDALSLTGQSRAKLETDLADVTAVWNRGLGVGDALAPGGAPAVTECAKYGGDAGPATCAPRSAAGSRRRARTKAWRSHPSARLAYPSWRICSTSFLMNSAHASTRSV